MSVLGGKLFRITEHWPDGATTVREVDDLPSDATTGFVFNAPVTCVELRRVVTRAAIDGYLANQEWPGVMRHEH